MAMVVLRKLYVHEEDAKDRFDFLVYIARKMEKDREVLLAAKYRLRKTYIRSTRRRFGWASSSQRCSS